MADPKSSGVIVTGGEIHARSHLIARLLLAISFFVVIPLIAVGFRRFISNYYLFFEAVGILFTFGFFYYYIIPAKYIPRFGYLIADAVFYLLIAFLMWQINGFVGFHILFFYMLLFGIINALSYNWRDIIITIFATSLTIVVYNFYSFLPAVSYSFLETLSFTLIELIILIILTIESRILAEEALTVQREALKLQTELLRVQELDRLKTEFISIASHQMRTPLSGIKWALADLRETAVNLTSSQQKIVALAAENINRMIKIVSGLLDIARIEERATFLKPETFSLKPLIAEIVDDLSLIAIQKGVAVETKISEDAEIYAVRSSLKQALLNIADNAIRYSEKPQATVIISSTVSSTHVRISVFDQGIGMSEEHIVRAFTKFFRAPEAVKMSPDGSGLGLYYAKRIIEEEGGTIKLESAAGRGTTVVVTLPVRSPASTV
ncbi:MAG: HAMP domain-containing histidine kinase [Candidatus Sungbacteria bacterium]|nr:HAMP domain-containing histidine kinase [Candidatus Sungbacteria bacterium]